MSRRIFVNLPVKDLNKTIEFFTKLGFKFDPRFTDQDSTCMIIGDNIFAMLLVEKFFKTFIKKEICDASKFAESIIALTADSKSEVDEMMNKVLKAGGIEYREPEDLGFMYGRSFQDLDGHLWELGYMDMSKIPEVQPEIKPKAKSKSKPKK